MGRIEFSEDPQGGVAYENTAEDQVYRPVVDPVPPQRLMVGINPAFFFHRNNQEELVSVSPRIDLSEVEGISFENRHLLGNAAWYKNDTTRYMHDLVSQVLLLTDYPHLPLSISSDGAAADLSPAQVAWVLGALPDGVGYEGFSPLASKQIKEGKEILSLDDLDSMPTVKKRGRAHADQGGPQVRDFTPTMGALCSRNIDPVVLVRWLSSLFIKQFFVTGTRWWMWEGWTAGDKGGGGGSQALSPYSRTTGAWDLEEFDHEYWARLRAALNQAIIDGFVITLTFHDGSGTRDIDRVGRWKSHMWNSKNCLSGQGIRHSGPGYPTEITETTGKHWEEVIVPLALKVREFLLDFPENLRVELFNEAKPEQARSPEQLVEWHQKVCSLLTKGVE